MPKKKKLIKSEPDEKLTERIKKAAEGLYYISETDAEIFPFEGTKTNAVTKENLLSQTANKPDAPVEERDFEGFFTRLTKIQDWFGDEEKQTAERFARLKELLEKNLKDLKVFKVGRIEIDIYVVGLDAQGNLAGIKTKAVET
jgi:Nuclease A inhibitor-like protein